MKPLRLISRTSPAPTDEAPLTSNGAVLQKYLQTARLLLLGGFALESFFDHLIGYVFRGRGIV